MVTTNAALAEGLEVVKSLVQRVCRGFYESKQSIVLDQLIKKEAMRDDELAGRVGMQAKDLAKIAQPLIADQIVAVYRRQELKEGAPKAQQRTYYFMDYSHAIDVIKWRMYKIQSVIDDKLRNELDSQGYICLQCKKNFTTLDASFLLDFERNTFVCDEPGCYRELVDNENAEEVKGSKDRMSRLIDQTRAIRDLLKKLDDVNLPRFDVMKWLELNGPAGTAVVELGESKSASGVRIELAGDDDEANMKAKKEADADAKRTQNQLPSWIAQSTVAKASATNDVMSNTSFIPAKAIVPRDVKPVVETEAASTDFDSYYASLEQDGEDEAEILPVMTPLPPVTDGYPQGSSSATPTPKVEPLSDTDIEFLPSRSTSVMNSHSNGNSNGGGSGKRSREDSIMSDGIVEGKKARVEDEGTHAAASSVAVSVAAEEEEDEFEEEEEEDSDPNPMISVGGTLMAFLDVKDSDELTGTMTPDEYTIFWDVYQRIG